jgi:hypothetical protein
MIYPTYNKRAAVPKRINARKALKTKACPGIAYIRSIIINAVSKSIQLSLGYSCLFPNP